jgi:hypothetical protein
LKKTALIGKFKQPSTWLGIALLGQIFGLGNVTEVAGTVASGGADTLSTGDLITTIGAALGIILNEKGQSDKDAVQEKKENVVKDS